MHFHRPTLLLAALALAGTARPLASQAPEPASLLPEHTALHAEISLRPLLEHQGELALDRIWEDPEVQDFLAPVLSLGGATTGMALARLEGMLGVSAEELESLLVNRMSLSFVGTYRETVDVGDFHYEEVRPDLVLTVMLGPEDEDTVRILLDVLRGLLQEEEIGALEDSTLAGGPAWKVDIAGEMSLHLAIRNGMLLAGSRAGTLEQMIHGQPHPLALKPSWRAADGPTRSPDSVFHLYVSLDEVFRLLQEEVGPEPEFEAIRRAVPVDALAYGFDVDPPGFRDRFFAGFNDQAGPLLAALEVPPGAVTRTWEMMPEGTGLYSGGLVSPAGLYDWIVGFLGSIDADARAEFLGEVSEFSRAIGMDLRQEVLPSFGPEFAFALAWPERGLIPDALVVLEVQDRERAARFLEALMDRAREEGARFGSLDYLGHELHYFRWRATVDADSDEPVPMPTWAFVGDYLVAAPFPQNMKHFLRGLHEGTPRLADHEDFRRLLEDARRERPGAGTYGISYVDLPALVRFALTNGGTIAQAMLEPGLLGPLDPAGLPTADAIAGHLFGVLGTVDYVDGGSLSEYRSPVGMLPAFLLEMAVLGAVVLTESSAPRLEPVPGPDF